VDIVPPLSCEYLLYVQGVDCSALNGYQILLLRLIRDGVGGLEMLILTGAFGHTHTFSMYLCLESSMRVPQIHTVRRKQVMRLLPNERLQKK
jgi:hypothetical protein